MALPSSFPLSAYQVRTELGIASNVSISMLSEAVRNLAGQPTGDVKFSELLGKSNITPMFDVLVVAGGGGGAGEGGFSGGGGGGGGVIYTSNYAVSLGTSYSISVGNGGRRSENFDASTSGENSSFESIIAIGGGWGAFGNGAGGNGGSGGGTDRDLPEGLGTAGQGNNGSRGSGYAGGGGGGANSAGSSPSDGVTGGNGGTGYTTNISGTSLVYGGGGGGGGYYGNLGGSGGGSGGSGAGGLTIPAGVPFANQGGGGGGSNGGSSTVYGSAGAAGVVIVAYPQQYSNATSTSGTVSFTIANGKKIYKWTSGSGSITF